MNVALYNHHQARRTFFFLFFVGAEGPGQRLRKFSAQFVLRLHHSSDESFSKERKMPETTEPKARADFLGVGTDLSARAVKLRPHRSTPPLLGFQPARSRATDSHAHHTRTCARAHTKATGYNKLFSNENAFPRKRMTTALTTHSQVHTLAHAHSTRHSADLLGCLREKSRRAVAG